MNNKQWGVLWGIGVGAGNEEWLTLKGLRILQSVSVVAMPKNTKGEPGIAYQIVKKYLQPTQKLLPLFLPFISDESILYQAWNSAVEKLIPILREGQDIVFISEGDISFYSTFTYIAQTLHAQVPEIKIEPIPGVCSPLAAAASLKTPLAISDEKVVILPALYSLEELEKALDWSDVVVLMKVASVFTEVWQFLAKKQLLENSSLVEWVGGEKEKIVPNLVDLAEYKPPYFSLLIVRRYLRGFGL